jgi:hypothetical protein
MTEEPVAVDVSDSGSVPYFTLGVLILLYVFQVTLIPPTPA